MNNRSKKSMICVTALKTRSNWKTSVMYPQTTKSLKEKVLGLRSLTHDLLNKCSIWYVKACRQMGGYPDKMDCLSSIFFKNSPCDISAMNFVSVMNVLRKIMNEPRVRISNVFCWKEVHATKRDYFQYSTATGFKQTRMFEREKKIAQTQEILKPAHLLRASSHLKHLVNQWHNRAMRGVAVRGIDDCLKHRVIKKEMFIICDIFISWLLIAARPMSIRSKILRIQAWIVVTRVRVGLSLRHDLSLWVN